MSPKNKNVVPSNPDMLPGMAELSAPQVDLTDLSQQIAAAATNRGPIDHNRTFSDAAEDQGFRAAEPHYPLEPDTSNEPINGDLPHETPLTNPLIRFVKSTMERRRENSEARDNAYKVAGEIAVKEALKDAGGNVVHQAALLKARETTRQPLNSSSLPAAIAPFFEAADNTRNGK